MSVDAVLTRIARMPPVLSPPRPRPPVYADAVARLRQAALARALDDPEWPELITALLSGRLAGRPGVVDRAVDAVVAEAAHHLLTHGWTPLEVHAFAARRLDPATLSFLVDALAGTARWTIAPPWLAELERLPTRIWWTSARPHVAQWAERHGAGRRATLRVVVEVLALLAHLPRTDRPRPGMPPRLDAPLDTRPTDVRTARRVAALLERAAATEFPAEAAACTERAAELLRQVPEPRVPARTVVDPRRVAAEVTARLLRTAGGGVRRHRRTGR
jgi:hypothetical protein